MDHLESLEKIRRQLCRERSAVRNELRNYPEGALMLVQEHGKVQKYMVGGAVPDRKRVGIGREPEMVRKLARKAFIISVAELLLEARPLMTTLWIGMIFLEGSGPR